MTKMNRLPPVFCRLLARRANRPMTNQEIAVQAKLGLRVVKRISRMERWDTIPLGVAEAYALACGVDLLRPSLAAEFLRRRRLVYMDRANPSQRRMMDRILGRMKEATDQGWWRI